MSKYRVSEPRVPIGPFQEWVKARCELDGTESVVKLIGFLQPNHEDLPPRERKAAIEAGKRRLFRYKHARNETKRNYVEVTLPATSFPRSVVEDALHNVDPGLFDTLYPGLDDDVTLEPDAWCPFCNQLVTPIDGLCPWCLCSHGHLFREVGISDDGFACLACLAEERRRRDHESHLRAKARREAA